MAKKTNQKVKKPSEALRSPEDSFDTTTRPKKEKAVQPDRWLVTPLSYEEDGTENPSELIFYRGDKTLVKMAVTKENFGELLEVLQVRFGQAEMVPEEWHVKIPPAENGEGLGEPVLSFTSKNRILMTLPMNQEFLKKFTKTLQGYIITKDPKKKQMSTWWRKHKVARVFFIIAALPLVLAMMAALSWAATA